MTLPASQHRTESVPVLFDILIAGAGISGTLAATTLAREGFQVCLIDRNETYPVDFKAEHIDGPMVSQLIRLGFLGDLTSGLYHGDTVTLARHGRVIGSAPTANFGLSYEELVNRARVALSPEVHCMVGRIEKIETSATTQRIRLADGRVVGGRLLVLATGSGYTLARQVGIRRAMLRERHSTTFGFDIQRPGGIAFEHSFLVYQRENVEDRIDYLAAFTLRQAMRVNLFTYRDIRDSWTSAFLDNPDVALARSLPGLTEVIGPYRTAGAVMARPVDLYTSENHRRDGVVMIGDAFQSTCPATGMGIVKVLTDIEQLVRFHVPYWLRTPGMSAAKTGQFYDDPVKRACDEKALHDSEYRRRLSTETTLTWRTHRARVRAMERFHSWRSRIAQTDHPRVALPSPIPVSVP